MGSHAGTHVDAPFHFFGHGDRIDDLDLDLIVGPAVIADVTGHGHRERIGWEALAPAAERLEPGTILALRTGWSESHYGTERYFEHPYLSAEACERILEPGGAHARDRRAEPGRDAPRRRQTAVRRPPSAPDAGGVIAKNLTNLDAVDFDEPLLCLFPLRLDGDTDGSPCRAVALELSG